MLLCAFWDVGKFRPEFVEFTSATIIYDQMKTLLVERYLEEKQPVEQKGLLLSDIDFPAALHRSLYYIAYQVQSVGKQDMSYGQIVHWVQELVNTKFPKSKADKLKAKIMHVIFSFDFIKLIEINDDRNQNRYEMLHLSMQEFLTACYLQDNFDDKAQDFLRKNRYNQQQLNVWGFTAGLMRDNEQELKQFFEILFEEPRDLIGAREIPIVMNCLIECLPEDITKKLPYWFEEIIESIISIIMEQKKSSKFHFDLGWGPSNNMPNLLSATRYLPNYIRQKLMSCDTKIDEASRLQTYNSNQIDKNKECAIKFGGSSSTQFQHDDQWDKTYELVLLEINKHKSAEFNWEKDRRRITSEMASAFELLYKRAMRSSSMPMLHSFICYHDHFFNTTIIEELQELAIHANDLDKSNKLLGLANLNSICCHSMYYLKFLILTNMMRTLIIYLSAPFMRLSNSYLIPDCDMGFLVKKINDLINGNSLLKKQGIAALIAAQEVQPIVKSTIGNCNLFHCLYGIRQHDLSTFINRLDYSYFLNQYNLNWEFITLFSNTSLQEIVTTISQTKLNSNKYEFLSLSLAYLICLKNIAVVLNDNIMNFFGESENNTFSTPITEIDIMKIAGFSTEYFGYRPIKYLAPNSSQNFSYRIFQEPKAEHSGEAELPLLGWTRFIP